MITDILLVCWSAFGLFCWLCLRNREDRIRGLEATCNALAASAAEALNARDDAERHLAELQRKTGAYLAEAACLVAENEYLKAHGPDGLNAEDAIDSVEAWLDSEYEAAYARRETGE